MARHPCQRLYPLLVILLSTPALAADGKPPWRPGGGTARLETEGEISRLVGEGWVRTTRAYLDPRVELEFRTVGERSEGAVLARAFIPRRGAYPSAGYRIILGAGEKSKSGDLKALSKAPLIGNVRRSPSAAAGEWQQLELRIIGNHLTAVLNGSTIADVEGGEHDAGYVGLEVKRGTVEFRRIRLSEGARTACAANRTTGTKSDVPTADSTGIVLPRVLREVKPSYTIEALLDGAQGTVLIEAVVMPNGSVGELCVAQSLHADLDVEALSAARRWTFVPGTLHQTPVPVLVTIELSFTLGR